MKKVRVRVSYIVSATILLFGISSSANILVNGDFSSAITMDSSKLLEANTIAEGGSSFADGSIIDDEWVTENTLVSPSWTVVTGEENRSAQIKHSPYGFW